VATYQKLKDDMSVCDGDRIGGYAMACRGQVYRCTACGATGCRQAKDHACTKQAFTVAFKCYACGATGQYEALASNHAASKSAPSTTERLANTD